MNCKGPFKVSTGGDGAQCRSKRPGFMCFARCSSPEYQSTMRHLDHASIIKGFSQRSNLAHIKRFPRANVTQNFFRCPFVSHRKNYVEVVCAFPQPLSSTLLKWAFRRVRSQRDHA